MPDSQALEAMAHRIETGMATAEDAAALRAFSRRLQEIGVLTEEEHRSV